MIQDIQGGLVVSCQALAHEPLHSSSIMAKMAIAAQEGGAKGIRANTKADILAIRQEVTLPIIGIVKRDYADSSVFITATKREVDELLDSGCEMIALDATHRFRPHGETLRDLVKYIRARNENVQIMADISSKQEAMDAEALGCECVSTTLYGYTQESASHKLYEDDFAFLKTLQSSLKIPVIAEGNVSTPERYHRALELGAHAVVVGGAITRPQQITANFVNHRK
ncbi:N-acetylmannosamine-6-phosphate 2-epimerase [Marinococcus halophilus]|uniref:Putative N-acetylmannosamine-6-phosphate 2-epimerase n=1 Tax=Marinococcus halophilus TaxID=1371 RepID=A0A510YAR5_MARHA|nr:N-acetylmannosamine-6-phosphate 2-epimerase [Marinococcus halophilus]OZT79599.1 N-acetylmannosamine-6-phosphate 2-epimerase [Marinococcus halophilus]GEK59467.1 putative N-acetylmannosamine-6-phosphate 2-epimerase [Marinococcus halophilus]